MRRALLFLVCTLLTAPIWGQSSGSFRIEQSQMNAGGRPAQGQTAASASFRIGLDTIAGSAPVAASSPSFAIESGFAGLYRPVGEVTGLLFTSNDALTWSYEAAALRYNVYRDGSCTQSAVSSNTATDADLPAAGATFFYLVTAVNRLHEEGPRGTESNGTPRPGDVCP